MIITVYRHRWFLLRPGDHMELRDAIVWTYAPQAAIETVSERTGIIHQRSASEAVEVEAPAFSYFDEGGRFWVRSEKLGALGSGAKEPETFPAEMAWSMALRGVRGFSMPKKRVAGPTLFDCEESGPETRTNGAYGNAAVERAPEPWERFAKSFAAVNGIQGHEETTKETKGTKGEGEVEACSISGSETLAIEQATTEKEELRGLPLESQAVFSASVGRIRADIRAEIAVEDSIIEQAARAGAEYGKTLAPDHAAFAKAHMLEIDLEPMVKELAEKRGPETPFERGMATIAVASHDRVLSSRKEATSSQYMARGLSLTALMAQPELWEPAPVRWPEARLADVLRDVLVRLGQSSWGAICAEVEEAARACPDVARVIGRRLAGDAEEAV